MIEQEALKHLIDANRNNQMVGILPKSDIGECLIRALEEVQQYRAIGTPEECRNSVLEIPKAYNKAIDDFVEKAMPEFTKYDLEHNVICIAEIKGILRNTAEQLKVGVENEQID